MDMSQQRVPAVQTITPFRPTKALSGQSRANENAVPQRCCSHCLHRGDCFAATIDDCLSPHVGAIVTYRQPVSRLHCLYWEDAPFQYLYIVCSGAVKTYTTTQDGCEKVTGFFFAGDLIGCSGLGTNRYSDTAQTLDTTAIGAIPFNLLENLFQRVPDLQTIVFAALSREIQEKQRLLTLLSKSTAEQRVADFLLRHVTRLEKRQFSALSFRLPMSRADIGNFLNLSTETVSRIFSRFQAMELLSVEGKQVRINNLHSLSRIANA